MLLLLVLGLASTLVLAGSWNIIGSIGGKNQSIGLLLGTFFGGFVDCSTSFVFWPYAQRFPAKCSSSLAAGESGTAVIATLLGLAQNGSGVVAFSPFLFFLVLTLAHESPQAQGESPLLEMPPGRGTPYSFVPSFFTKTTGTGNYCLGFFQSKWNFDFTDDLFDLALPKWCGPPSSCPIGVKSLGDFWCIHCAVLLKYQSVNSHSCLDLLGNPDYI